MDEDEPLQQSHAEPNTAGGPEETEAERFVREFKSIPLLPQLQAFAKQLDREIEVLTTIHVPEESNLLPLDSSSKDRKTSS